MVTQFENFTISTSEEPKIFDSTITKKWSTFLLGITCEVVVFDFYTTMSAIFLFLKLHFN